MGFDPSLVTTSSTFAANVVVIAIAIPYWIKVEFDWTMFYVGLFSGFVNTYSLTTI